MNSTRTGGRTSFSLVVTVAVILLMAAAMIPGVMGVAVAPTLGGVANYSILAGSAITGAGSFIMGDVGISPASGSSIGVECADMLSGDVYDNDAGYPNAACRVTDATLINNAVADRATAYGSITAAGQPGGIGLATGEIGGLTLAPGLYTSPVGITITNDVTLDAAGDSAAVWVFQSPSTLGLSASKKVILSGGALPENVYWQVDTATSLGADSVMNGNIFGQTTIAFGTNAKLNGRATTATDVSLLTNTITRPDLVTPLPPVASFTVSNTTGSDPLYVQFTDTSTGTPTSWAWDLGDGTLFNTTVSPGNPPLHTYSALGAYTVNLTVTDDNAFSSTTSVPASVTVVAAPVLNSAETNADGTRFILTFDKAMDDPAGKQAQFTFQNATGVKAFSTAAINGSSTSVIDLITTTPVVNGDVITFSYTPGTITSTDGGVLAILTDQPVTNGVPAIPVFPTVVWAATNPEGTVINITFTKAMADPAGNLGAFMYQVGGGADQAFTAIALNTTTTIIDLTLSTPVVAGDVVTVNYTAGSVAAADATLLASFDNQPVTNSVPSPIPTMTGIDPVSGSIAGGTLVTIAGTGYNGATAVTFDGTAASSYAVVNDTHITATTPAHAAGAVDVIVTTTGGTATGTGAYTYAGPPTFTGIIPASGTTLGGTAVTITGTNFVSGGSFGVTIGGAAATSVVRVDATHITAVTPAGTAGPRDVVITNNDGQSVTATGVYTYVEPLGFTSITPNAGPTTGGTAVTITGTNFVNGGSFDVMIGTTSASSIVWVSATQITAVTPVGTEGVKNVKITNNDGQTVTGTNAYTYVTPPAFTSIAPASGSTAGGNTVTITGTGFTGATAVNFGVTPATAYTVQSPTKITATVPAHAAGVVDVTITTSGGIATGTNAYTFVTPATAVNLGTAGNYAILAESAITSTGPTLVTGDMAISPAAASYIEGFGLVYISGAPSSTSALVTGNVYAADYAAPTPATLTTAVNDMHTAYTAAMGATPFVTEIGSGNLGGMTLAPGTYKFSTGVLIPTDLTLDAQGDVDAVWIFQIDQTLDLATSTNIILSNGAQAKNVFWAVAGTTTLGANSVFNGIILDKTNIAFTTGATLNGRALAQTAVTLQSNPVNDPVTAPVSSPSVSSIAPTTGSTTGGDVVIITGTGFTGATSVTFNDAAATGVTVDSDTQITATTPAGMAGAVDITVTTPDGVGTGTALYTYGDAPTFTSVAPASGSTEGGNRVTITGTGFTGTTGVTFDGIAASSFTVDSDTQITAITPDHVVGAVDVIVTTGVAPVTGTNAYTYVAIPIPTISGIAPASGPAAGGTVVGITGTDFTGATAVTFGGTAASSYTVDNATHITATTAAHAAGAVNVLVTTPGGTQTAVNGFTYVAAPTPAPTLDNGYDSYGSSSSGSSSGSTPGISEITVESQLAPTMPSSTTWVYDTGTLTSIPFSVDFGDMFGIAVSWTTKINQMPAPDARIITVIQPNIEQSVRDAFNTALHRQDLAIGEIPYVMIVQKYGIPSSGPATVTMNIPQNWVDRNGGTSAIRILMLANDGTVEILETTYIGNNAVTGNPTFEAQSPRGLATFGLIAVIPYDASAQTYDSGQQAPTQEAYPVSAPVSSEPAAPEGIPMMLIGGILAALTIIGIAGMTIIRRNK